METVLNILLDERLLKGLLLKGLLFSYM